MRWIDESDWLEIDSFSQVYPMIYYSVLDRLGINIG